MYNNKTAVFDCVLLVPSGDSAVILLIVPTFSFFPQQPYIAAIYNAPKTDNLRGLCTFQVLLSLKLICEVDIVLTTPYYYCSAINYVVNFYQLR